MSEIVKILTHTVDLRQTLEKTDLHTLFVMGDNEAHRFELEILSGSEKPDLTGSTVTGYFTNFKEDTTIKVGGKVEEGRAVVVLSKPCYTLHGQFVLTIQVKSGDAENTVFMGEGYMRRTKSETIIYDDYIVYDVSTLLAQISAMEAATKAANAAAGRAPYIGGNGNWYVWDAAKGAYADSGQKAQGPKGDQGDVTQEQFNQLSEQKVDKANVVNNFTTTEEGFVADARAAKTLNDRVDGLIVSSEAISVESLGNGASITIENPITRLIPLLALEGTRAYPLLITNTWSSGGKRHVVVKNMSGEDLANISIRIIFIDLGIWVV